MAEKNLKARIQQKHDFEINWQKATNFIPKPGELIIYDAEVDINGNVLTLSDGSSVLPEGRSTPYSFARFKIGDGINVVTSLPFATNLYVQSTPPENATVGALWIDMSEVSNIRAEELTV